MALIETMNPLPHRFITLEPGVGGAIKQTPEDFLVEELSITEPSGGGEHLYLRIRKRNLAHGEAVALLARHFRVSPKRIGFAGMKDKRAVAMQSFTIHTPHDYDERPIDSRLEVLWSARHERKLRRGHLAGNRFVIRIRDVEPTLAPRAERVLHRLEQSGVPNYFGSQRFGYRLNNHLLGAMLLRRQWRELCDELLGLDGSPYPEHQQAQREMYQRGEYDAAASHYGRGGEAERAILRALAAGRDHRRAVLSAGRRSLSFWANATQSAVFNALLDDRIDAGTLASLQAGDLAWKHDSRAVFAVDDAVLADPDTAGRLERLEISPSGPIWSPEMTRPGGAVDAREIAALKMIDIQPQDFESAPVNLGGSRRPFRVRIENPQIEAGVDETGGFIRIAFDLPRGSYATVVLREIMKTDIDEEEHAGDIQDQ